MAYGFVTLTAGEAPTKVVSANTARKAITLVNNSGVLVYIGPDVNMTVANAIPLYEYTVRDTSKIPEGYAGDIYATAATSTADIRWWETV